MIEEQSPLKELNKLDNEIKLRCEKLTTLRSNKKNCIFPNNFKKNISSNQLHNLFNKNTKKEIEKLNIYVSIAGRIISIRVMGKASFITIQDSGGRIQLYISCKKISMEKYYHEFKQLDIGDIIGVRGHLFKTNTGELSIYCEYIVLLTKALRHIPDKFHGLSNKETCYRKRYLDLISNEKSRETFIIRSEILVAIRNFMKKKGFMEVETPMMQITHGGANANPFVTYHNALNIDMYLRIAPELYLKRLIIGGFERIFEINRSFRNEGISSKHNPEFTMMELYMAYSDYKDIMRLTEEFFFAISKDVLGNTILKYGDEYFDFCKPFQCMTMIEAICYNSSIKIEDLKSIKNIRKIAISMGINIQDNWKLGNIQFKIFEDIIEQKLIQPTFITEYPIEVSPLARRNDKNPFIADRFELFIAGIEIANGFSELNDSEDQSNRFLDQLKFKDHTSYMMPYDYDYIQALEYGLPPTAGLGIGIDRLIMLFTNNKTIRDVILFPTMRPNH